MTDAPPQSDTLKALEAAETWLKGWASAEPYLSMIRTAIVNAESESIDAARYRYLRNRPADTIGKGGLFAGMTPPSGRGGIIVTEEDLDRRVDEAMKAEQP